MRLLLFALMTTLTISSSGQSIDFIDNEGIKIKLIDARKFTKPTDVQFFRENISGRLIFPTLDTATIIYEFDIEKIKVLKKKDREFELTITQRSQPKNKKQLRHFGRGFYRLTIKKEGKEYVVDKLEFLNVEI